MGGLCAEYWFNLANMVDQKILLRTIPAVLSGLGVK
jgi:hypothetical protein